MSRKAEHILWLSVLLGLVLDPVPFLSALSQGQDSAIDRFYQPAVWTVQWLCGSRLLAGLRPVAFFSFCTVQNALLLAGALMLFQALPLGRRR